MSSIGENGNTCANNPFNEFNNEEFESKCKQSDFLLKECNDLLNIKNQLATKDSANLMNESPYNYNKFNHCRYNSFANFSIGTNKVISKLNEQKQSNKCSEGYCGDSPCDNQILSSPYQKNFNENIADKLNHLFNYNSCDSNYKSSKNLLHQFINHSGTNNAQIHSSESKSNIKLTKDFLDFEERKVSAMEIKMLQNKLLYYNNQLLPSNIDKITEEDRENILNIIKSIQLKLERKTSDFAYQNPNISKDKSLTLDAVKALTSQIDRFDSSKENKNINLNNFSYNDCEDSLDIEDAQEESRISISTIKTTISIPNEFECVKIDRATGPKLSQMLTHHKMISKPNIDFGQCPEPEIEIISELSRRETVKDSQVNYNRLVSRSKYKDLKMSAQFAHKNCFNR